MVAIDNGTSANDPLQIAEIAGTTPVGTGFTEPLTPTFCGVTPVDEEVMVPDGSPEANAASLTNIVVVLTVPPEGASETLVAKPLPGMSDISKPAGATISRFAVKPVPATVNVCSADTMPAQAAPPGPQILQGLQP